MALSSSLFVYGCRCWGQKWGQAKQPICWFSMGSLIGVQVRYSSPWASYSVIGDHMSWRSALFNIRQSL
jgi:hypothetical protein